ncbi:MULTISPECIES: rod shape-determining protein MreB [Turicibacter]|jgi:cell division protein ftsA|uniref:Cell shape-determining protein MreB n=2 Tax=Turicibacter sanguinis TaxID=154288 RepID=A0A173REI0_9FIRM|nr:MULTISPECIES: rod shape-determining protein MreB [Turicibacter]EFF63831.1 cell division protein FtsA [Turicibacter sanguinis PC909]EGC93465.1 Mbl protein [Turicibacter sp. HGF1]MBP3905149.1 rod shape-determining protein MreB [Turicibacter sp.]MCU7191524.1 rod shape-determining protein MreB [Turicibacter sanguinis]MCU7195436.1 rod shape-determining protein MreB [Turicibacter sanguinis]
MLFSKDIGIDLGTANVLIYEKGKGIVLEEPSVVSIDAQSGRMIAAGEEARQMLGRTPGKIEVVRPMKDGVIADIEATEMMLKHFINSLNIKGMLSQPRIMICCPTNITLVEKNAIREAAEKCGAREVFIEEEPKIAALGAGMDISKPSGNMVIDVGGGTADIAVLSLGDIVTSASIKIAGNRFDQDIVDYIKTNYKLLIGDRTAEEIKISVATVYPEGREEELQVRGRDLVSGLPRTITISSTEVEEALRESVRIIVHAAKNVLEQTPPELSADIMNKGIVLTGGGALLHGLDRLLADELHVPVFVADNPLHCVVVGTGIMLDHIDKIRRR